MESQCNEEEASFHQTAPALEDKNFRTPMASSDSKNESDDELSQYLYKLEKPQNYFLEEFHAPIRIRRKYKH